MNATARACDSTSMNATVRATLSKDTSGGFGVEFSGGAGGALLLLSVDELAAAEGLRSGMQLLDLVANGMDYDTSALSLRALHALLSRNSVVTLVCGSGDGVGAPAAALSLTAADGVISHEDSAVHTVRGLLSAEEVDKLHAAAQLLAAKQRPHAYTNELIGSSSDEMPFGLRPQHESLFLHEDGFLMRHEPALCSRIVDAVRARHPGGEAPLGVRCIEYHTYRIGGALLDPEHRDMGSTLTMSCLLVSPEEVDGGVFLTWERGRAVCHDDLQRGDAVIFHSERVHNVSAVMGGTRHSLVVELWEGPDNRRDRHA